MPHRRHVHRGRVLLWIVPALLLFWAVRAPALTTLPMFIDEAIHAQWAQGIWQGHVLHFTSHGKLLHPWLMAPGLPPDALSVPWVARAFTLLGAVLGAAGAGALARQLGRHGAVGALSIVLLTLSPAAHVYDRLALSDVLMGFGFGLVTLTCLHTFGAHVLSWRRALLGGVALTICTGTKATALAILPLPLVAAVLLARGWRWCTRGRALALMYITALVMALPVMTMMALRGLNYFDLAMNAHSAVGRGVPLWQVALQNTPAFAAAFAAYHTIPLSGLWLLFGVLALVARPRPALVVAAGAAGVVIAIAMVGSSVRMRYWVGVLPLLTALVAYGAWWLAGRLPRVGRRMVMAGLVVGSLVVAWPTLRASVIDATRLPLPAADYAEYIAADSSGVRLPELAAILRSAQPTRVIGLFSNCLALHFIAPDLPLECPTLNPSGNTLPALSALIADSPSAWVVLEVGNPYVPQMAPGQHVATLMRPSNLTGLALYAPGNTVIGNGTKPNSPSSTASPLVTPR